MTSLNLKVLPSHDWFTVETNKLGWPYSPILLPHSPEKQSIREGIEHLLQVVSKVTRHSSLVLCPGTSNESGMKS